MSNKPNTIGSVESYTDLVTARDVLDDDSVFDTLMMHLQTLTKVLSAHMDHYEEYIPGYATCLYEGLETLTEAVSQAVSDYVDEVNIELLGATEESEEDA